MNTFVLMVILALPGGKDFIQTQEFEYKSTCEAARHVILQNTDEDEVKAFCLKK